jgi:hypothetical protein
MAALSPALWKELTGLIELERDTYRGLVEVDGDFSDIDRDLVVLENSADGTAVGFSSGRLRALEQRGLIVWGLDVSITDRGRELVHAAGGPDAPTPTRSDVGQVLEHVDLHPAIDRRVRRALDDADHQHAVAVAFGAIEGQIRAALSHRGEAVVATGAKKVVEFAFAPGGPLSDPHMPSAEQVGVMQLFQGAIAAVRNPNAHGEPTYTPAEALRLVLFADHLLHTIPRTNA